MATKVNGNRIERDASITVTADGVKTYSTLLGELYALIDFSKVTINSILEENGTYYLLNAKMSTNNYLRFSQSYYERGSVLLYGIILASNSTPFFKSLNLVTQAATDLENLVPASGSALKLYY